MCVPINLNLDCKKTPCADGQICKSFGFRNICIKAPITPRPSKPTAEPTKPAVATEAAPTQPGETKPPTKPARTTRPPRTTPVATTPVGCDAKCLLALAKKQTSDLEQKLADLDAYSKAQKEARDKQIAFLKASLEKANQSKGLATLQDKYDGLKASGTAQSSELKQTQLQLAQKKEDWARQFAAQQDANAKALAEAVAALKADLTKTEDESSGADDATANAAVVNMQAQIELLMEQLQSAQVPYRWPAILVFQVVSTVECV